MWNKKRASRVIIFCLTVVLINNCLIAQQLTYKQTKYPLDGLELTFFEVNFGLPYCEVKSNLNRVLAANSMSLNNYFAYLNTVNTNEKRILFDNNLVMFNEVINFVNDNKQINLTSEKDFHNWQEEINNSLKINFFKWVLSNLPFGVPNIIRNGGIGLLYGNLFAFESFFDNLYLPHFQKVVSINKFSKIDEFFVLFHFLIIGVEYTTFVQNMKNSTIQKSKNGIKFIDFNGAKIDVEELQIVNHKIR